MRGKAWVPEGKYWTVPKTENAVEQLIELFKGERVEVTPDLQPQIIENISDKYLDELEKAGLRVSEIVSLDRFTVCPRVVGA